jgi:dTMP kinase
VGDLRSDLTLVLDVPIEIGLQRAAGRRKGSDPDRFEAETAEFHERLRQAYLTLAAAEPERCVIIDASAPKMMVAKQIWQAVKTRLRPVAASTQFADAAS